MRPRRATWLWIGAGLASVLAAQAQGGAIASRHRLPASGACFVVHARMFVANGGPSIRLWPVGSQRILGVFGPDGDAESPRLLPTNVKTLAAPPAAGELRPLFGDFRVCPLAADKPGRMRQVWIRSATHLVLALGEAAR